MSSGDGRRPTADNPSAAIPRNNLNARGEAAPHGGCMIGLDSSDAPHVQRRIRSTTERAHRGHRG